MLIHTLIAKEKYTSCTMGLLRIILNYVNISPCEGTHSLRKRTPRFLRTLLRNTKRKKRILVRLYFAPSVKFAENMALPCCTRKIPARLLPRAWGVLLCSALARENILSRLIPLRSYD